MAVFFNSGELYRIAEEMEKTGLAYYSEIARNTADKSVKAVFQFLAAAEKRHQRLFRRMMNSSPKSSPPESYKGEYRNYLAALLKEQVFPSSASARSRAARSGVTGALNTGIKTEKDSILFYSGLLDLVRPDDRTAIDKIINEEKRHLRKLMDYKYKSGCFLQAKGKK